MPWYNGDYPPSYKNQPVKLREKAVEMANALLEDGAEEGVAIATGLKQARAYFKNKGKTSTNALMFTFLTDTNTCILSSRNHLTCLKLLQSVIIVLFRIKLQRMLMMFRDYQKVCIP